MLSRKGAKTRKIISIHKKMLLRVQVTYLSGNTDATMDSTELQGSLSSANIGNAEQSTSFYVLTFKSLPFC